MDLLSEVKLPPLQPPPLKKKKWKREEWRETEQWRKSFIFLSYKVRFSPAEFRCSVFFFLFCLKNVFSITSHCVVPGIKTLLQKCSNGQISTARRKGKIEKVFSIIASVFPLVLAVEAWPATIREMSDWFCPSSCCHFLCLKCCYPSPKLSHSHSFLWSDVTSPEIPLVTPLSPHFPDYCSFLPSPAKLIAFSSLFP